MVSGVGSWCGLHDVHYVFVMCSLCTLYVFTLCCIVWLRQIFVAMLRKNLYCMHRFLSLFQIGYFVVWLVCGVCVLIAHYTNILMIKTFTALLELQLRTS